MAKVTPANVSLNAFPRVAKKVLVRDTKHGLIAQAWPKKRGKATSGYDFYRQTEFGIAAAWAADAEPNQLQTAINMAAGTVLVPRDILIMAMMGTFWTFVMPDGTVKGSWRVPNPNPQLVLDMISDTVGSILYRAPIGWVALGPGNNGQLLAIIANTPTWVDAPVTPVGGGVVYPRFFKDAGVYDGPLLVGDNSTRTYAISANTLYFLPMSVTVQRTYTSAAVRINNASGSGGSTARFGIYQHSTIVGGPGQVVHDIGTIATNTTGLKTVAFTKVLDPGPYWLCLWSSHALTISGCGNFAFAGTPGNFFTGSFNGTYLCVSRALTYGAVFPDETAQTETPLASNANMPLFGMR